MVVPLESFLVQSRSLLRNGRYKVFLLYLAEAAPDSFAGKKTSALRLDLYCDFRTTFRWLKTLRLS